MEERKEAIRRRLNAVLSPLSRGRGKTGRMWLWTNHFLRRGHKAPRRAFLRRV